MDARDLIVSTTTIDPASSATVIVETKTSPCPGVTLPSGGILHIPGSDPITLSTVAAFRPVCLPTNAPNIVAGSTGSTAHGEADMVDIDEASTDGPQISDFRDPFYASTFPQCYALAATTVVAYTLVIMLFITPRSFLDGGVVVLGRRGFTNGGSGGKNIGGRPWLQKVAALTVAISMTIATSNTFRVAENQYAWGIQNAQQMQKEVLDGTELKVIRIISDTFLWLAQAQTLIRLFPRQREKVIIKWTAFSLVVLDLIFDSINQFVYTSAGRTFTEPVPALAYLFQLALGVLYAAWVIYYSLMKKRYAFFHQRMRNICLVAMLSLLAILVPVVFFILDISKPDFTAWGDYVRWVGAAAASVIVWEWVERIEALEREEKKDGILGREVFDGDEMLDIMPNDFSWPRRRRKNNNSNNNTNNNTNNKDANDDDERSIGGNHSRPPPPPPSHPSQPPPPPNLFQRTNNSLRPFWPQKMSTFVERYQPRLRKRPENAYPENTTITLNHGSNNEDDNNNNNKNNSSSHVSSRNENGSGSSNNSNNNTNDTHRQDNGNDDISPASPSAPPSSGRRPPPPPLWPARPAAAVTPASRTDTASADSTVYVMRYHPVTDGSVSRTASEMSSTPGPSLPVGDFSSSSLASPTNAGGATGPSDPVTGPTSPGPTSPGPASPDPTATTSAARGATPLSPLYRASSISSGLRPESIASSHDQGGPRGTATISFANLPFGGGAHRPATETVSGRTSATGSTTRRWRTLTNTLPFRRTAASPSEDSDDASTAPNKSMATDNHPSPQGTDGAHDHQAAAAAAAEDDMQRDENGRWDIRARLEDFAVTQAERIRERIRPSIDTSGLPVMVIPAPQRPGAALAQVLEEEEMHSQPSWSQGHSNMHAHSPIMHLQRTGSGASDNSATVGMAGVLLHSSNSWSPAAASGSASASASAASASASAVPVPASPLWRSSSNASASSSGLPGSGPMPAPHPSRDAASGWPPRSSRELTSPTFSASSNPAQGPSQVALDKRPMGPGSGSASPSAAGPSRF